MGTGGRKTDCSENVCGGTVGWKGRLEGVHNEIREEGRGQIIVGTVSVKERMFGQNVDFVLETLGSH